MPIYEYRCETCDHQFEVLQRVSEEPLKECPNCGQARLVKLISAAGFRLKGGGWYETDFKSRAKSRAGKNLAAQSNAEGDAASGNGGEAKTAAKSGGNGKAAVAAGGAKTMDTVKDQS